MGLLPSFFFSQDILENYLGKQGLGGHSALSWKQCVEKPVAVARSNIFKKTVMLLSYFWRWKTSLSHIFVIGNYVAGLLRCKEWGEDENSLSRIVGQGKVLGKRLILVWYIESTWAEEAEKLYSSFGSVFLGDHGKPLNFSGPQNQSIKWDDSLRSFLTLKFHDWPGYKGYQRSFHFTAFLFLISWSKELRLISSCKVKRNKWLIFLHWVRRIRRKDHMWLVYLCSDLILAKWHMLWWRVPITTAGSSLIIEWLRGMLKSPFCPENTDIYLDSQRVFTFFTGICVCLEVEDAGR